MPPAFASAVKSAWLEGAGDVKCERRLRRGRSRSRSTAANSASRLCLCHGHSGLSSSIILNRPCTVSISGRAGKKPEVCVARHSRFLAGVLDALAVERILRHLPEPPRPRRRAFGAGGPDTVARLRLRRSPRGPDSLSSSTTVPARTASSAPKPLRGPGPTATRCS